jgi:hypothetical protein
MDLMAAVGKAAAEKKSAIVLFIDELQYVLEEQLAALIIAVTAEGAVILSIRIDSAGCPTAAAVTGSCLVLPRRAQRSADRFDGSTRRRIQAQRLAASWLGGL